MSAPLPTSTQSLRSWKRDIDRAIDSTGARTLESASISEGTLRVIHGGNVTIGDGGSFVVSGGNLVLGKGKIEGEALKEQFEPVVLDAPQEECSSGWGATSWETVRSVRVNVPAWAEQAAISCSFAGAWREAKIGTAAATSEARLLIDGQEVHQVSGFHTFDRSTEAGTAVAFSGLAARSLSVREQTFIEFAIQAKITYMAQFSGRYKKLETSLAGIVIFSRGTS